MKKNEKIITINEIEIESSSFVIIIITKYKTQFRIKYYKTLFGLKEKKMRA